MGDPNWLGFVRLCQLYQAAIAEKNGDSREGQPKRDVRVVLTGVKKKASEPTAEVLKLSGNYVNDLSLVASVRQQFSSKAVDPEVGFPLALGSIGCGNVGATPAGILRVGNNAFTPPGELAALRKRANRTIPFAAVDTRGHIFKAHKELPKLPNAVVLPGQVESCATLIRNILAGFASSESAGSSAVCGDELLVRHVDMFLKRAR